MPAPVVTSTMSSKQYEVTGTVGAKFALDIQGKVRELLVAKLKEKKLSLVSIKFTGQKWTDPLHIGQEVTFKAVVTGSPIAPAVIAAAVLAVKVALIIAALYVVGEFIVKPIFVGAPAPPPPAPPPTGAPPEVWEKYYSAYEKAPEAPAAPIAQLTAGLGNILPLLLLAGGAYLVLRAKPWEKKKPEVKPA